MSLAINDALQNNSPKPVDNKYGVFTSGNFRAYLNTTEANTTILSSYRSVGLTVLINNGTDNVEYWYQDGTADGNLVPKTPVLSGTSPVSVTAGVVSIQQANTSQPGYVSSGDWNTFNNKVSSVVSVGGGTALYGGTSSGVVSINSLSAGTGITLSSVSGLVTISTSPYTTSNVGAGAQLAQAISGTVIPVRSITAGPGITVTQNANDVNIALSGNTVPTPASTVNSSPTVIASVTIPNESAGLLLVTMVGIVVGAAGSCTTAQRYVQYYKTGGVLNILGTIYDLIPEQDNTFTTTSWTIIANNSTNNFDIQVTGQSSTTIKWAATIQNYTTS